MKFGVFISLILHGTALIGSMWVFSGHVKPVELKQYIPVDLVDISEQTNVRAAKKAEKPEQIKEVETPAPIEPEEPEVNTVEKQAELTLPTPEPVPVIEKVDPEVPPEPVEKPKTKTSTFDLDRISALVDKSRKEQVQSTREAALQSEREDYEFARTARAEQGLGTQLTLSEIQALQSKMYRCWRVPLDATNPEELSVRVRVQLYEDGAVEKVELMDRAQILRSSDPYLKIAAERAVRAVSKCAPYDFLSAEKYSQWKDMELTFRPEL